MTYDIVEISNEARLSLYILDNSEEMDIHQKRPIIIVCPGGGYEMTSDREAESIAMKYLGMNYHACVLRYSLTPNRFPQALLELGTVIKYLNEKKEAYNIDTDNIFINGFSAGGHLGASYGVLWNKDFVSDYVKIEKEKLKPKGLILGYPVITADTTYMHSGSFENLLGEDYENKKDELSLENQVSEDTPPTFLWHTANDNVVPVENSLLFATALSRYKIPFELHIYPRGEHGLALANETTAGINKQYFQEECQNWIELVAVWLRNVIEGNK
jgi:acetyl esterase/lipase